MEYVEGRNLKELILESAPFPIERALTIAIQVCAAVGVLDEGAGAESSDALGVDWANGGRAVARVAASRARRGTCRQCSASISLFASSK